MSTETIDVPDFTREPWEQNEDIDVEPAADAPPRERMAWFCKRLDGHWPATREDKIPPDKLATFVQAMKIALATKPHEWGTQDFPCLRTLDSLCALLSVTLGPVDDHAAWFPQFGASSFPSIDSLRRQLIRESQSFAESAKQPRPPQPRKTPDELRDEGVKDDQICRMLGWHNRHGGPDRDKLDRYYAGEYKLTEADKFITQPTSSEKPPRLFGVHRLFERLRDSGMINT